MTPEQIAAWEADIKRRQYAEEAEIRRVAGLDAARAVGAAGDAEHKTMCNLIRSEMQTEYFKGLTWEGK